MAEVNTYLSINTNTMDIGKASLSAESDFAGCISEVKIWSSEKSAQEVTNLQKRAAASNANGYIRHEGKHCDGSSISKWADGSNADYGAMSGIESCKAECDAHAECAGFVQRDSDNKSSTFSMSIAFCFTALDSRHSSVICI